LREGDEQEAKRALENYRMSEKNLLYCPPRTQRMSLLYLRPACIRFSPGVVRYAIVHPKELCTKGELNKRVKVKIQNCNKASNVMCTCSPR
jgi:hypothetical protein